MSTKTVAIIISILIVIFVGAFFLSGHKKASNSIQGAEQANNNLLITITDTGFQPQNLTINAGQTITWKNNGSDRISLTSDPHPTHTNYPPLNLGMIAPGQSVSLKFDKVGTYGYHNHLNPSQIGQITVE